MGSVAFSGIYFFFFDPCCFISLPYNITPLCAPKADIKHILPLNCSLFEVDMLALWSELAHEMVKEENTCIVCVRTVSNSHT